MGNIADVVDIEQDMTPMGHCESCSAPVNVAGQATSVAYIRKLEEDYEELEAYAIRLLLALEPFGLASHAFMAKVLDAHPVFVAGNARVSLGDLRRAHHLIAEAAF